MTNAPRFFAIWQSSSPTPPAAAWTSARCPARERKGRRRQIVRGQPLETHGRRVLRCARRRESRTALSAGTTRPLGVRALHTLRNDAIADLNPVTPLPDGAHDARRFATRA